jgi:hypothetical protein
VLKPVVERYQGKVSRIYFRADAGFANPEVYEFLEAERIWPSFNDPIEGAVDTYEDKSYGMASRGTRIPGKCAHLRCYNENPILCSCSAHEYGSALAKAGGNRRCGGPTGAGKRLARCHGSPVDGVRAAIVSGGEQTVRVEHVTVSEGGNSFRNPRLLPSSCDLEQPRQIYRDDAIVLSGNDKNRMWTSGIARSERN